MLLRILLTTILISTYLLSSTKGIDTKITLNKKILNSKNKQQKNTNNKIKNLAYKIKTQEQNYDTIQKKLSNLNSTIFLNKVKLSRVKQQIVELIKQTKENKILKTQTEASIVEEITNRYSASIGVSLAKKQTTQELIDKEIYSLLLEESAQNVLTLNLTYLKLSNNTRKNKDKTEELTKYIEKQESEKVKYKKLKVKSQEAIKKLSKQHKNYQNQLKKIISKQEKLQDLLGNLNILKTKEIKKERQKQQKIKKAKIKKAKKIALAKKKKNKEIKITPKRKLKDEIDIEVRNIGSSSKGVKITKYKGGKTIAPLKSYNIVKKFGKYYDPVYKLELFNEALSMKPKKANSKVYNILKGKIVYAKKNSGTLENVVIVQHKNGLHTIYSHLDKIAPTLKTGKWIKQGFVVGRVSNTLMFQATKNNKYINPKELFR